MRKCIGIPIDDHGGVECDILSRLGLAEKLLREDCSKEIRLKIALKLEDWKMVGHFLDIPSEKLKAIERENDTEDQRKVAMLDTWNKRNCGGASYWRLTNALYQHGRRDLVESLCKAMLSSSAEESSVHCVSAEVSTDGTASSKDIMPERCESGTSRLDTIIFQQYSHD